jgi:homoserine kinase type II
VAVYTEVDQSALEAFLVGYDVGHLIAHKGIAAGVENSNFRVTTSRATLILTLYERRVAATDLPFFLGLMEYLAEGGLVCPTPVRNRQGDALGHLAGRPAALVTFLEGAEVAVGEPSHCRQVGAALARLHRLGAGFEGRRANALSLAGWGKLAAATANGSDGVAPGLADEIAAELSWLEARWPGDLPTGVIHADLFPDNVFFRNERLSGLIDFYFACTDAYAYDLAIALNAWCFDDDGCLDRAKSDAMVAGYLSERALNPSERAALPTLMRGSSLRFLLTRLYDWINHPEGALVQPKDPLAYRRRLSVQRALSAASDYGL